MSAATQLTENVPIPGHRRRHVVTFLDRPLPRMVAMRLVMTVPLLFIVSALSFVLLSVTPGDAAEEILGPLAPHSQYLALRKQLGLNLPLHQQYWRWVTHAIKGDLGTSIFTGETVTHAIDVRIPVSLSLILCSLLVVAVFGVGLGSLSAVRGGVLGRLVDGVTLVGFALPGFWIGAVLIVLFAVKLRWLPAVGYVPLAQSPIGWLRSLLLPVAALSLQGVAAMAKQTREAMLDALGGEYVQTARANGIGETSIALRHALKNASGRIVTMLGLQAVGLLGGTVLVEIVFALPGVGSLLVHSALEHDLPVVQGIALYFTVIVVFINFVVDLAYGWLNPRVRIQ